MVGIELARRRDWRTCLGGVLGLLVPVVCAELLHPGIWKLWVYREQWPQQALGANVSALFRIASGDFEALSLPLIVPLSIILGLVVYRIGIRELGLRTFTERYMLAFLVWPFFSPYGFLSDQVVLILPVAFFVQRILSMSDNVRALQFLTALTLLVGLTYLMDIVVLFQTRLSWFFFAPSLLVLVRSFGRSITEVTAE